MKRGRSPGKAQRDKVSTANTSRRCALTVFLSEAEIADLNLRATHANKTRAAYVRDLLFPVFL